MTQTNQKPVVTFKLANERIIIFTERAFYYSEITEKNHHLKKIPATAVLRCCKILRSLQLKSEILSSPNEHCWLQKCKETIRIELAGNYYKFIIRLLIRCFTFAFYVNLIAQNIKTLRRIANTTV